MNSLIARLNAYCKHREMEIDADFDQGMASIDERAPITVHELRALLNLADRARVRATSEELPGADVLAWDGLGWQIIDRQLVRAFPRLYTRWLPLPEVTK